MESEDERKELKISNKWGDSLNEDLDGKDAKQLPNNDDLYKAYVLWIKNCYGKNNEELTKVFEAAFKNSEFQDLKVLKMFHSTKPGQDHAYVLINNVHACDAILEGELSIPLIIINDQDQEETVQLSIDKADHLSPREDQDPYVLYLSGLPTNVLCSVVEAELTAMISSWIPIESLSLDIDRDGMFKGSAKVKFEYKFDTLKCIYLLNFNHFMGSLIRAAFCNKDWKVKAPRASPDKSPKSRKESSEKRRIKAREHSTGQLPKPAKAKTPPKPSTAKTDFGTKSEPITIPVFKESSNSFWSVGDGYFDLKH